MTPHQVELQGAVGFLADQIDDLRLLLRTTPSADLAGATGQELMQQAMDAMSTGIGMVLARKLIVKAR